MSFIPVVNLWLLAFLDSKLSTCCTCLSKFVFLKGWVATSYLWNSIYGELCLKSAIENCIAYCSAIYRHTLNCMICFIAVRGVSMYYSIIVLKYGKVKQQVRMNLLRKINPTYFVMKHKVQNINTYKNLFT